MPEKDEPLAAGYDLPKANLSRQWHPTLFNWRGKKLEAKNDDCLFRTSANTRCLFSLITSKIFQKEVRRHLESNEDACFLKHKLTSTCMLTKGSLWELSANHTPKMQCSSAFLQISISCYCIS